MPGEPPGDAALFRSAIGIVRPIRASETPRAPTPMPEPRHSQADEEAVAGDSLSTELPAEVDVDGGEALAFLAEGRSPTLLRKLRRGFFRLDDEIDLHGLRVAEAEPVLQDFLKHARRQGARVVRIVHGKARGRGDAPRLKALVDRALRRTAAVLAFCSARPAAGGTGAVDVLLERL